MKKALLVSYYFPPRFTIGGKRAYRFARYLPEYGWSSVVLTAQGPRTEKLDPTFRDDVLPACEIRRDYLTDDEIAALPTKSLGSDGTIAAPTKMWSPKPARFSWQWWETEFRYTPIVGPAAMSIPKVARRIVALAQEIKPDILFATSSPWETAVAATLAGRELSVPVVLDFRDPWSFGLSVQNSPTLIRWVNTSIEAAILKRASALTVTSETTRDQYRRLGHAPRVECIRNGYDPAIQIQPVKHDRFTMVHFGNCYANRTLAPFLRAAAYAVQTGRIDPANIRILNLGRVSEEDLALAKELGIIDQFEYHTVLPYEEGLAIVAGADLALLLAFGEEPWFIPGKLYDYVAARTPILSLATSAELDGLVQQSGLGWVHPATDINALAECMADVYDARQANRTSIEPNENLIESLSARNGAGRLAGLFDELCRR